MGGKDFLPVLVINVYAQHIGLFLFIALALPDVHENIR